MEDSITIENEHDNPSLDINSNSNNSNGNNSSLYVPNFYASSDRLSHIEFKNLDHLNDKMKKEARDNQANKDDYVNSTTHSRDPVNVKMYFSIFSPPGEHLHQYISYNNYLKLLVKVGGLWLVEMELCSSKYSFNRELREMPIFDARIFQYLLKYSICGERQKIFHK